MATFYAIRRKGTDDYLPAGRSRGFTHDEPTSIGKNPPRLFVKEVAARAALRCWLMGEWQEETSGGGGPYGDDYDVYPEPPKEPPPERKPEDMEIVKVQILAWSRNGTQTS